MLLAEYQPHHIQTSFMLWPILVSLLGAGVWIFMIILSWRAVKAHESIAESLRRIAQKDQSSDPSARA